MLQELKVDFRPRAVALAASGASPVVQSFGESARPLLLPRCQMERSSSPLSARQLRMQSGNAFAAGASSLGRQRVIVQLGGTPTMVSTSLTLPQRPQEQQQHVMGGITIENVVSRVRPRDHEPLTLAEEEAAYKAHDACYLQSRTVSDRLAQESYW